MPVDPHDPTKAPPALDSAATLVRLGLIGLVGLCLVLAFVYVGGWLSPHRLTQNRVMAGFEAVNGKHPGFRRNHAKGVCGTGWFESNGNAASVSKAALFAQGRMPVVGRIAFAGGMPFIPDDPSTVRSLALRILPPGAEEWRTGMVNIPVFPFDTAQGFYDEMIASAPEPGTGKPDPAKMQAFVAAHPEFGAAIDIIKARKVSSGFADATYNSLDTFRLINAAGVSTPVRWSAVPVQPFVAATTMGPLKDPNGLFDALIAEVDKQPVQWRIVLTLGQPGDPVTPNMPWSADHQQIDAGIVTIDKLQSEDDGPCIDVNYDPTVLPAGMALSDDPIPSARSAAYARSFTLREGERSVKPPSAVTPREVAAGGKS